MEAEQSVANHLPIHSPKRKRGRREAFSVACPREREASLASNLLRGFNFLANERAGAADGFTDNDLAY